MALCSLHNMIVSKHRLKIGLHLCATSVVYAVTRLGGLYVWLNFLNILGQHMTHSGRKFNHVDLDHNQEWLNGTGKKGGGIVGKNRHYHKHGKCSMSGTLMRSRVLFSVEELGQSKLYTFDEERLVNATVKFRDRVQKSNSLSFKSLCKVSKVKGD